MKSSLNEINAIRTRQLVRVPRVIYATIIQFPNWASCFSSLLKQIGKITASNVICLKLIQIKLRKYFAVSLFNIYVVKCAMNILFTAVFPTSKTIIHRNIGLFSLFFWINLSFLRVFEKNFLCLHIENVSNVKKIRWKFGATLNIFRVSTNCINLSTTKFLCKWFYYW